MKTGPWTAFVQIDTDALGVLSAQRQPCTMPAMRWVEGLMAGTPDGWPRHTAWTPVPAPS
ncbi:hypothetical protein GCM10018966_000410 [Streptomyces yanii]